MTDSRVLSSKGRVTIPKGIRVRLGLRAGDRMEFVIRRHQTIIRAARTAGNPFEKFVGALGSIPGGIEEINAWVRSLRGEAPEKP